MDLYQDAQLTEDSRMTLGEYLDRWMEEYGAVTLRPNTLRSYEQYIPVLCEALLRWQDHLPHQPVWISRSYTRS